ncbi:Aldehyde dehydrogenase family 3 member I1 chloroplastic [Bienertia sinuspersici]
MAFSIQTLHNFSASATISVMEEDKRETSFDADQAGILVKELKSQFDSGKTKTYEWRLAQLESLSRMMDEKEKDITEALYKDLSKPEFEAFIAEISMIKSSCKLAVKELKQWMMPEKVKTPLTTYPSSAEIVSEPLGIVLVISTWNYPFSAGNAVVLKPSEIAPATSSLLAKLLEEYVDNTSIKVIEGAVDETSALLEQKWDKIFYTGSGRVGRIVMAAAAKHLTPVVLELGGKCPVVVDSDVNLQVAARRIIAGKWGCNNGQTCTAVDYSELNESFGKNPMESKDMSRIVNLYHVTRLMKLLEEDGVSDKIVLGGEIDEMKLKIAPTIVLDAPEDSALMTEEIFGPLLPIVTVEKIEESFEVIKSKPKPLAAYLFTNNEQLKNAFVKNISAGGMLVNDTILHLTVSTLPFGGVGESGMGYYHGKFSFEAFSHKKAVMYRSFDGDSSIRYPPYTPKKLKLLKSLMSGNFFQLILTLVGWSKD